MTDFLPKKRSAILRHIAAHCGVLAARNGFLWIEVGGCSLEVGVKVEPPSRMVVDSRPHKSQGPQR